MGILHEYQVLDDLMGVAAHVAGFVRVLEWQKLKLEKRRAKGERMKCKGQNQLIEVGHERFAEYFLFQEELGRIINERIMEVRRQCEMAFGQALPEREERGLEISGGINLDPDGDHVFIKEMDNTEEAVRIQAEMILLRESFRKKDVDVPGVIQRFMRNSLVAQYLGDHALEILASARHDISVFMPGVPDYFDRPDLFSIPGTRPILS